MIYKEHKIQFFLLAEKNLCFGVPPPHEEVAIFLKEKFADSECGENCENCVAMKQFVYHYIYYRETNIENCESCAATQQFVYHYIHREVLYEHYKA